MLPEQRLGNLSSCQLFAWLCQVPVPNSCL